MRRSRRISYLTQSYETNSGQEKGDLCCGGHPHIPRGGGSPLQPFPGVPRSDVLACGRPSLVRYYALTEQVPLNLNTYLDSRVHTLIDTNSGRPAHPHMIRAVRLGRPRSIVD